VTEAFIKPSKMDASNPDPNRNPILSSKPKPNPNPNRKPNPNLNSNPRVAEAFMNPAANKDASAFDWPLPKLHRVRAYCKEQLGWTEVRLGLWLRAELMLGLGLELRLGLGLVLRLGLASSCSLRMH
jgi:hypothetical protein